MYTLSGHASKEDVYYYTRLKNVTFLKENKHMLKNQPNKMGITQFFCRLAPIAVVVVVVVWQIILLLCHLQQHFQNAIW